MSLTYILSQVFVLIATCFTVTSYFVKNRIAILALRISCGVFFAGSYLLLTAYAGFATNIVSIIRVLTFFLILKKREDIPFFVFIIFEVLTVAVGIITWGGWITLLVIAANIIDIYAVWQKQIKVYRIIGVATSTLFIAYSLYYASYVGVVTETVALILKIVSVIAIFKEKENNGVEVENKQLKN